MSRPRAGAVSVGREIPARIFLRPIGVPLPLGMAGLAVASFVTSGLELHWIAGAETLEIGVILVAVPFTLQLLACVFSYLARDGATGAILGVLASTWLAVGLIHIASPTGRVDGALGLLLIVAGGAVTLSAVAVGSAKPLPGVVFLAAALRFELAGIYQLSAASIWADASGILGLVVTGLAAYCLIAFELEGLNRAPVLPTFRRGRAAVALDNGPSSQLDRIEHEPGVRQTS